MTRATYTCPQCLQPAPGDDAAQFCPRCGLRYESASQSSTPMELNLSAGAVVVRDRLAFGDVCNLYRCTIGASNRAGLFKIARTHESNAHVANEAATLRRLHAADSAGRFTPFLPALFDTANYTNEHGGSARTASVLCYHDGIPDPDALYPLNEVRDAYHAGVDARDMAWMWRRILTILGFVHQQHFVHGAVTPAHVLIEPQGHKLVLIGWCGAVAFGAPPRLQAGPWRDWSRWDSGAAPGTDLASAARSMRYLLSESVEPAIDRHLERAAESNVDAWQLLKDFDRVIEALWGPRRFRPFVMPTRAQ